MPTSLEVSGRHAIPAARRRPRVLVAVALMIAGLVTVPAVSASAAAAASTLQVQLTAPHQEYGTPIAAVAKARVNGAPVAGKVRYFFDGKLAFEARTDSAGNATWKLQRSIAVGNHTMTVYFLPSVAGVNTSAVAVPVQVRRATPTISVAVPKSRPPFGSMTTMSIAVSAKNLGMSTGTVSLYEGARYIGAANLSNGATQIHFPLLSTPGNNVFTVKYSGSAPVNAAWRAVRFATSKGTPTVQLGSVTANFGGGSVGVTVSGPRAGTGTVIAVVDGVARTAATLSGGSATLPLPSLSPGSHRVRVAYQGDLRYNAGSTAMRYFTVAANPCSATARACVDLTNNLSWLQSGGRITYGPVPITAGRAGYRTNPGMFSIYWRDIDHRSSLFNDAPMPYSQFFDNDIAFHEGSLYVQSHGCIHLSHAASVTYWNSLNYGDVVHVFGKTPY